MTTTYTKESFAPLCNSVLLFCNNTTINCVGGMTIAPEYYDFYCSEEGLSCDDLNHFVDGTTAGDDEAGTALTMRDELGAIIIYANDSGYYANETAYNADGTVYMKQEVSGQGLLCNNDSIKCNDININCFGGTVLNKEAYS